VSHFSALREEVWLRALLGRLRKFEIIHITPSSVGSTVRRLDMRVLLLICRMIIWGIVTAAMLDELAPSN